MYIFIIASSIFGENVRTHEYYIAEQIITVLPIPSRFLEAAVQVKLSFTASINVK